VKIGTVTSVDLDRKTYQAVVHMAVTSSVQIPADTNAKIVAESLLGGMVIVLDPGGDKTMIKPGGEIGNTQDAISFTELLAKFMFSGTGSK
jgi:phospholipid/cholesterol/gamma-HCH transport system substrate-binding protein